MHFKYLILPVVFSVSLCLSVVETIARERSEDKSGTYPKLTVRSHSPECQQILKAAKILFHSNCPELIDNPNLVQRANIGLVLAPQGREVDAPENHAFWFDTRFIEAKEPKYPQPSSFDVEPDCPRAMFWQKDAVDGHRFLIGQRKMNWEGDWYDLCSVRSDMPVEKFHDFIAALSDKGQTQLKKVDQGYVIYCNYWQRPWLFYNKTSKLVMAVDPKASWSQSNNKVLSDWAIYVPDSKLGARCIGTISFCPTGRGISLLPKGSLRELSVLLDKIIGIPSQDEGTFRATPRLRSKAANAWCNLMLRPWAIEEPRNSAMDIETGLKKWAKGSPVYKQQYAQLKVLYPKALDALTVYYQSYFHKSPNDARKLATKSLDLAYRNNFSF